MRTLPSRVRARACQAAVTLVAAAATACDPLAPLKMVDEPQTITQVTVLPESTTVVVGDTLRFAVELKGVNGKPIMARTVVWSPGNPAVASINDSGLVTARAVGRSEILATVDDLRASAILVVTPVPPPPPPPVATP